MITEPPRIPEAVRLRCSVRRFERMALTSSQLDAVQALCQRVTPLVHTNRVEMRINDVQAGENLVAKLGGYGMIVTPPHYLVIHGTGSEYLLEDIGYRSQQVAVGMVTLGLGSCFIGCLSREARVRAEYRLTDEARVAAFLVFGHPSRALAGRSVNSMMRYLAGATRKLPADQLFFAGDFDHPSQPPAELAPLIEAARLSPSAANSQPWRFLQHKGRLFAFVLTRPRGLEVLGRYRRHDGGIALANACLALPEPALATTWIPLSPGDSSVPAHPVQMEPLAVMRLP